MCSRCVKVSTWPIILGLWSAAFDMMSGHSLNHTLSFFFRFVVANSWIPFSEAAWVDLFFLDLQNLTDYDWLYNIVHDSYRHSRWKSLAPPWMTYDICHVFTIDKYIIYCLVIYPFHKEWDIHYFGIPQLDVFAGRAKLRLPTPPFFQAALRGEKYHEALDAAERAIALTGGRTHWVSTTGNRREVVGCIVKGQFFFATN